MIACTRCSVHDMPLSVPCMSSLELIVSHSWFYCFFSCFYLSVAFWRINVFIKASGKASCPGADCSQLARLSRSKQRKFSPADVDYLYVAVYNISEAIFRPNITKLGDHLTHLLQKLKGCIFYGSQCIISVFSSLVFSVFAYFSVAVT